jgi:hypothetical protein
VVLFIAAPPFSESTVYFLSPAEVELGPVDFPMSPGVVLFIAAPPFSESTVFLSPAEVELGPVDFPVSPWPVFFMAAPPFSEEFCWAMAPATGNANKPAASSIEREIEPIAVPFQLAAAHAATSVERGEPPIGSMSRSAAHAESSIRSKSFQRRTNYSSPNADAFHKVSTGQIIVGPNDR